jgi:hypothetical protein
MGTGQKPSWQKAPQHWNNHTILLHLFYIEGDIKELMQKIKYFKNIFFHILFIAMFISKV